MNHSESSFHPSGDEAQEPQEQDDLRGPDQSILTSTHDTNVRPPPPQATEVFVATSLLASRWAVPSATYRLEKSRNAIDSAIQLLTFLQQQIQQLKFENSQLQEQVKRLQLQMQRYREDAAPTGNT